ncbi:hypothetical protein BDP27DRAFT_1434379 [Rhodocollybia butyracea]|uniref:Uncharacterized protein n=1 Tax=Rhodocollybia butyracea TaxID=206335 RepID=A0A9P5P6Y7_9AGAR|nr:hypothetical protein BDP27DRAFT_1434379 [Rhodocollybia butyracea]
MPESATNSKSSANAAHKENINSPNTTMAPALENGAEVTVENMGDSTEDEKRTLFVQDEAATILAPGSKSLPKKRKLEGSTEESTKKGRTGAKRAAIKSREIESGDDSDSDDDNERVVDIDLVPKQNNESDCKGVECKEELISQQAAAEAIAKFHHDPKNEINYGLRRLCCTLAWFAPESGTSSRPLAIHVMTTKQGNLICPYHTISDHWGCAYDEDRREDRAYRVTGVPKAPIKKSTKKNPKNPDPRVTPSIHQHCDILKAGR